MTTRRLFSVEEANALLPQLETLLSRLLQKKEALDRLHDEFFMQELLHEATASTEKNSRLESGAREVDGSVSDLDEELTQFRSLGCILRNLDAGWVEFPAEWQGTMIYYCWKKGETAIQYYRKVHAAFAERLPL